VMYVCMCICVCVCVCAVGWRFLRLISHVVFIDIGDIPPAHGCGAYETWQPLLLEHTPRIRHAAYHLVASLVAPSTSTVTELLTVLLTQAHLHHSAADGAAIMTACVALGSHDRGLVLLSASERAAVATAIQHSACRTIHSLLHVQHCPLDDPSSTAHHLPSSRSHHLAALARAVMGIP
jgi:hypothetical protein